ncbi:MAG: heme-binding domain-containing protein [Flavobacteriales bacterium]|nr:heme-binding domain-containing protein [Flavobacteriales bacterium]
MLKRLLSILLGVLLVAQFIRPDRSVPAVDPAADLFAMEQAPPDIQAWVKGACYDCHSYATEYPWYAGITPVNWWLQRHIDEGREVLNFSRWDQYRGSEAAAESGEEMAEDEMPPKNYTWMHDHARLTPAQHQAVMDWFNGLQAAGGEEEQEQEEPAKDVPPGSYDQQEDHEEEDED